MQKTLTEWYKDDIVIDDSEGVATAKGKGILQSIEVNPHQMVIDATRDFYQPDTYESWLYHQNKPFYIEF